jgi:EAL domain-containing protein (putative c-di-GMP-specific phosphodiesterase class I)/cellobiose-specific phosphotransferase system component IIC
MRDGMLWLVPYLMVWTTFELLAEVARVRQLTHPLLAVCAATATAMRDALPLAIWGSVASMLAVQAHLPRAAVAFVAISAGLLVAQLLSSQGGEGLQSLQMPLAIIGPLLLVPLMVRLSQTRAGTLGGRASAAGQNVSDVLNLVLPAIAAVLVLMLALSGLLALMAQLSVTERLAAIPPPPPLLTAAIYSVLNSLLWWAGIHGYYALLPLLEWLPAQSSAAQPWSQSALGVFVFIGGSGGTASLILALLLSARERKHRLVAAFSVVPACLNVNELLLFGLPLIFNRHLFWPFVLVPLLNLCSAVLALHLGLLPPIEMRIPFTGPLLLNALFGSGGQHGALALQLVNIALGTAVYLPFVRRFEQARRLNHDAVPLRALESSYARRREEAVLTLDDPVLRNLNVQQDRWHLRSRLKRLDQGDFLLHYQPKVAHLSGQVVSCEALLRLQLPQGQLLSPAAFLDDLARAGLMREVDLWVLQAVVLQVSEWKDEGMAPLSMAVNMSVDTLGDARTLKACTRLIADCPWPVIVEITEQALVGDEASTQAAIAALKQAGATVHVDDFGTGFSSLSYLHRFDIDGIKIDRSFTLSLDRERGRTVFAALCSLAQALGLDLVVEGVEHDWQLAQLPPWPDLTVQGWIHAPALPPERFVAHCQQSAGQSRAS